MPSLRREVSPIRHTWDASQRQTLCLLYRFYEFDNAAQDITTVFNTVHKTELKKTGHTHGLRQTVVQTQLYNLSHRVDNYVDHIEILNHSYDRIKIKYQKALTTLEKAMVKSKIAVKARGNVPEAASAKKVKTRERYEKHRVLDTPSIAGYDSDDEVLLSNRKLRNLKSTGDAEAYRTVLETIPDETISAAGTWLDICRRGKPAPLQTAENGLREPVLLFRSWTQSSGLKARKIMAHPPTGNQLREIVKQHLDVDLVASPFLSTSRSLRHPLRHVERISKYRQDCFVSVISYREMVKALDSKYGQNTVHMARGLCQQFDILGQGYFPALGEFLVFQEIPASAVICTFPYNLLVRAPDISRLLQVDHLSKALAPPMNAETGRIIGSFLDSANVPMEYKELMAWRLARDSRFQGASQVKVGIYASYMAGVFGVDHYVRHFTPGSEIQETNDSEDAIEEEIEEEKEEQHPPDIETNNAARSRGSNDDQEQESHGTLRDTNIAFEEDNVSEGTVEGDNFVPRGRFSGSAEREDQGQTAIMQFSRELLAAAQHVTPVPVKQHLSSVKPVVQPELDTTARPSKRFKSGRPVQTQSTLRWPSVKSDGATDIQNRRGAASSGPSVVSKRTSLIAKYAVNASVLCPKPPQPTAVRAKPVTRGPYRPGGGMNAVDLTKDNEAVAQDLRRSVDALSLEPEAELEVIMARTRGAKTIASAVHGKRKRRRVDANDDDDLQILERIEID